ncbi:PRTRC system ThiF family protein (plasmid) [Deinococcus proteolyticus MRP]|uniref:PRTRC system ThiF family protein n=1 Tax=Deinococcus proteolyticus (strain ATCC 35074 / DSM 20540 / JCM 6276 / NBRC 101906 / NCIMB 13154 / VKM Ac-1939 / CCM 2703 / MRP) TaxID=693977 RepID=F0RQC6_DEIPM|nr:PRTRC system ThiF family protein [Deinococcus proteolyticus]ADY27485.1 PRTRC system ThiF family protein [Deinococcus proteolyticus MRP]
MNTPLTLFGDHPCTARIALIGAGGTGSELLSHLLRLHQALISLQQPGLDVTVYDADQVSESNLVRQRFSTPDLGQNKAITLVRRINLAGNVSWRARPQHYTGEFLQADIVISCVDSRSTRAELHGAARQQRWWWLDCGNDHTTGQVILGRAGVLPLATELHPELMDTALPDDGPSCSTMEALQRQDLFVNAHVAAHAADLLWNFIHTDKGIQHHARYFSLQNHTLSARSIPV